MKDFNGGMPFRWFGLMSNSKPDGFGIAVFRDSIFFGIWNNWNNLIQEGWISYFMNQFQGMTFQGTFWNNQMYKGWNCHQNGMKSYGTWSYSWSGYPTHTQEKPLITEFSFNPWEPLMKDFKCKISTHALESSRVIRTAIADKSIVLFLEYAFSVKIPGETTENTLKRLKYYYDTLLFYVKNDIHSSPVLEGIRENIVDLVEACVYSFCYDVLFPLYRTIVRCFNDLEVLES